MGNILAAGVRIDPVTQTIQAVVVITDEDGKGHPSHLNPHKSHAELHGHTWLEIPPETYKTFRHRADLEAHVAGRVPLVGMG